MESFEDGRRRLVETIEQTLGHPLSSAISEAFLQVSREHFVPTYLKQVRPSEWISFDTQHLIYQDRPFTTKINTKNMPCSSSSQPSIMAAMLEALVSAPA
jgi:protein-L-isoaspartate O-methyltransferase